MTEPPPTNDALPKANEHPDTRLYVPDDHWEVHIRRKGERFYCYGKFEGEDWHHQIVTGEIYLKRGAEVLCLSCAMRHGVVSDDRLFWQHLRKDPNRKPLV